MVRGSVDSAKLLALLEYEFAARPEASSKNADLGYYLCRAVLPLLVVGKLEEALACFEAFKVLIPSSEFVDEDKSKLLVKHSLYNFVQLLLLILVKNAGDKFGSLISSYLESLEFDELLLESCNKIGAAYFKIGVREKQSNPFADMFKQMMAGPPAPQISSVEFEDAD